MEEQHVARLVVGRRPARLVGAQQPWPQRRAEVTARQHRESAELYGDIHERQPRRQHVLHTGEDKVLMNVAALGVAERGLRIHGAQHLAG